MEIGIKDPSGGWIDGVRVDFRILPDDAVLNALAVHGGKLTEII
jgi:hypothetical protein